MLGPVEARARISPSTPTLLGFTESVMGLQPLLFIAETVKEVLGGLWSFECMLILSSMSLLLLKIALII